MYVTCVIGRHRGISRHYSNIKYPLFARGRGASGVTAVGVCLNLITEQNMPVLTEACFSKKKKADREENRRTMRAHAQGRERERKKEKKQDIRAKRISARAHDWPNYPNG